MSESEPAQPDDAEAPAVPDDLSFDAVRTPQETELIPSIIELEDASPPEPTRKIALLLEGSSEPVDLDSKPAQDSRRLSGTQKILSATWKKATGGFRAFTSGFAWRTGDEDPDGPKVISRRRPSGKFEAASKGRSWVLGVLVVLGLIGGVTGWIIYLKGKEPPPTGPLFPGK